jgi:mRNA interferase MazF
MVIRRGEIWWASLPDPQGSGPGFRRPVLVVQADSFNRSRIQTVLAAAITSNTALGDAPGNIVLSRRKSGLPKESVVNVSQLVTLDKRLLTEKIKRLDTGTMQRVDDGLRLVLNLGS